MNRSVTAEERVIADADVPAEHNVIGEGYRVADVTIVAHVATNHEQTTLANAGFSTAIFGPGIHGDAFTQFAARPYHQSRGAAAIVDRLRRRSERSERIDHGPFTNGCYTGNMNIGDEAHTAPERDVGSD